MFQTIFLPHQHGRSALDTSRTLFLLASTQGVSCRLVMNHLIYMYMFSLINPPPPPPPPPPVSVCTFMCIYLFSCPSVQYFAANDILTLLQYKNIDISFLFGFGNSYLLTFSTLIISLCVAINSTRENQWSAYSLNKM